MQAVGDLHQDNPKVFRHGHGHFLEVFGLCFRMAAKCDFVELADSVHQISNSVPELGFDRSLCNTRIFNYIVQHGSH